MSREEFEAVVESWSDMPQVVRVPHTEKQYDELVALLDRLIDKVGNDESHPLASLMEVVGTLIEQYEEEHVPELGNVNESRSHSIKGDTSQP
jgi:HTH-type transcriptional regulator/antitoxin HigA